MSKLKGFTLIELLISMALGLVISLLVVQLLISSNRTASLGDGILEAQETGRFAMSLLSTAIQKAGFAMTEAQSDAFAGGSAFCAGVTRADCIDNENNGAGDRISIVRTSTNDDNLTCSGQNLANAAGATYDVGTKIIDSYWVDNNSLRCRSYAITSTTTTPATVVPLANEQSLVENVEALHVLYGIESASLTTEKSNVTRYLPSHSGTANTKQWLITNWQQVRSVKFSILTRSSDANALEAKRRTYVLLDATPYTLNDGRARQIFTTSVMRMN